ncbi:MAG: hypothetical protein AB7I98_20380 [Verrucomicrobiales bacterium]
MNSATHHTVRVFFRPIPRALWAFWVGSFVFSVGLFAALPTATVVFPSGGTIGRKTTVTVTGKLDPWPVEVWCSQPGVAFTAGKKAGEYTVDIAATVKPGPCLVRFHNGEGASEPLTFVGGMVAEILEVEPNTSLAAPQVVKTLPVTINGKLEQSEDADLFQVSLKKGQTLVAHAESYSLGAPMDALIQIFDAAGGLRGFAHDNRVNLDPEIAFVAPSDGDYTVAVMGFAHPPSSSISFAASANAVYRLTLTTGPWLAEAVPAIIEAGRTRTTRLIGWNLAGKEGRQSDFPLPGVQAGQDPALVTVPGGASALFLPVTTNRVLTEAEVTGLTGPFSVFGTLGKPKEVDHYSVTAKKGEIWRVQVIAQQRGSPLDAVLVVQNTEGKELKRADDLGKYFRDAELVWTVPADGTYQLLVSDLFGKGGFDYTYECRLSPSVADFRVLASASAMLLEAGKSVEVKMKLERLNGHKAALTATIPELPPGVSLEPVKIPEKPGDFSLTLKASPTAGTFHGPVKIVVKEAEGAEPTQHEAVFSFQDAATSRGPRLIDETTDLWLTVKPVKK